MSASGSGEGVVEALPRARGGSVSATHSSSGRGDGQPDSGSVPGPGAGARPVSGENGGGRSAGTGPTRLAGFWDMTAAERERVLLEGVADAHRRHFGRNAAYRRVIGLRGVAEELPPGFAGPVATGPDTCGQPDGDAGHAAGAAERELFLARLLRPAAATFKSYIDVLGTPFPNDVPRAFLEWLADQLSIALPVERARPLRSTYGSLEALLRVIEKRYRDLGLEVLTSSGTSGRASIIVRDASSTDLNVESFYLCFQRYFGMTADHRAIFLMPRSTRIAMARMARFSVSRVGLSDDRVHFAIPFPAQPDQVRIRAGRTYRFDRRGVLERRLWHPAMARLQEHYVDPRATRRALALLDEACRRREKVLLFGSLIQVHRVAQALRAAGRSLQLEPGSLLGTGGGIKELYPHTADQIRADVASVVRSRGGDPVPIRDVYGMAEANWAAMQCAAGNYHVPPWVLVGTLDDDDAPQRSAESTGMLAFWDPFGGGGLYPAFFRSADRVTLVRPDLRRPAPGREAGPAEPDVACPCGDGGAYIRRESIRRVDRLEEAGCAAQM